MVFHQILGRQCLVGKGHIHHRCGMPFGSRQINETALRQEIDVATVGQKIFLEVLSNRSLLFAQGFQTGDIELDVEMPGVGHHGTVEHDLEVLPANDILVPG